jgi:hypothetical protein
MFFFYKALLLEILAKANTDNEGSVFYELN